MSITSSSNADFYNSTVTLTLPSQQSAAAQMALGLNYQTGDRQQSARTTFSLPRHGLSSKPIQRLSVTMPVNTLGGQDSITELAYRPLRRKPMVRPATRPKLLLAPADRSAKSTRSVPLGPAGEHTSSMTSQTQCDNQQTSWPWAAENTSAYQPAVGLTTAGRGGVKGSVHSSSGLMDLVLGMGIDRKPRIYSSRIPVNDELAIRAAPLESSTENPVVTPSLAELGRGIDETDASLSSAPVFRKPQVTSPKLAKGTPKYFQHHEQFQTPSPPLCGLKRKHCDVWLSDALDVAPRRAKIPRASRADEVPGKAGSPRIKYHYSKWWRRTYGCWAEEDIPSSHIAAMNPDGALLQMLHGCAAPGESHPMQAFDEGVADSNHKILDKDSGCWARWKDSTGEIVGRE